MELFGATHIGMLILTLLLCMLVVWAARRFRGTIIERRTTRVVGWGLLVMSLIWMAWGMLPRNWDVGQSIPLHLSDVLQIVTVVALIARPGWAICVAYYWGLTLNLQSLLTPDLNYVDYPLIEFTMYWLLHIVVFLVPVVFTFGLGYRPTWTGYVVAYAATAIWAGITGLVNVVTGANYGYLGRRPEGGSLLDVLGPWPVYILWEALLIAVVWALMTWPWTASENPRPVCPESGGSLTDRPVTNRRYPVVLRKP